jgi:hypothetical protein
MSINRVRMPLKLFLFAVSVAVAGCQSTVLPSPGVTFSGGKGYSIKDAVVIHGSSDESVTNAEYPWPREHFPGSKLIEQALINSNGRAYDGMKIATVDGTEITVYFDFTSGFGRL